MKCPYCSNVDSKVTDSRTSEDGIRRRRECLRCGLRFTTYERVQSATLQIIKRDGRREDFSRDKLAGGIRRACAKRPLPMGAIEKIVEEIDAEVQSLGRAEVPSSMIGEMVMDRLKLLDRVAFIRYASVYRDFADIDNFREEIETLLAHKEGSSPSAQLPLLPEEKPTPVELRRRKRQRRPRGSRLGAPARRASNQRGAAAPEDRNA
ncbi:MAG: transcriptional repressor NrdR [Dehalococcoidia bacterium]|nr:transcriptional repressor NrdR [Dehalococcoidia bacterium]